MRGRPLRGASESASSPPSSSRAAHFANQRGETPWARHASASGAPPSRHCRTARKAASLAFASIAFVLLTSYLSPPATFHGAPSRHCRSASSMAPFVAPVSSGHALKIVPRLAQTRAHSAA